MQLEMLCVSDLSETDYINVYNELSGEEKQRIALKSDALSKKESLLARKLLKDLIGQKEVLYTDNGKPYIEGGPHFSISHTNGCVGVAVSDRVIGLDIESVRPFNKKLAERHFTNEEIDYIKGDNVRYIICWTLKEAILKATGQGIAALGRITLSFKENGIQCNEYDCELHTKIEKNIIISVCEIN